MYVRASSRRIHMLSPAICFAFAPIGEYCCCYLLEVMLTSSAFCAVVFTSIRTLCAYVRAPDASEIIPSLCGFFVRDLTLSLGESGSFQVVLGLSDGFRWIFRYFRDDDHHNYDHNPCTATSGPPSMTATTSDDDTTRHPHASSADDSQLAPTIFDHGRHV